MNDLGINKSRQFTPPLNVKLFFLAGVDFRRAGSALGRLTVIGSGEAPSGRGPAIRLPPVVEDDKSIFN